MSAASAEGARPPAAATLEQVAALLRRGRVLPVIRFDSVAQVLPTLDALARGGAPVVEITLRTQSALAAIVAARGQGRVVVGAGTVRSPAQVDDAVAAGASFVVSPGFTVALAQHCRDIGVPLIPGVATASEVMAAGEFGLDLLKFFPAESLGGIATLQALQGPFADIRFVPTGGITAESMGPYLRQPNVLAVGGSWLVEDELLANSRWDEVERRARQAVIGVG